MPNTEVKLSSADGTWTAGSRESRSSPGLFYFLEKQGYGEHGLARIKDSPMVFGMTLC